VVVKFSINKTDLQKALQELSKGVPSRSTLPILSCGLFLLKENKLVIRTTDLEISLSIYIDVEGSQDGEVAIPMAKLLEICNAMPEGSLEFETSDIGKLKITNSIGSYTIMGQSPEEYPAKQKLNDATQLKISTENLLLLINNTIYAVSKDDLKPALQGVLFNISTTTTTTVATDGHRLVKVVLSEKNDGGDVSIIIPSKFLNIIKNRLSSDELLSLSLGEDHIQAEFERFIVSSRIIKEKYPDFESVIPKDNNFKVIVNKNEILDSVKRVSIFSNKTTKQIALGINEDNITLSTEDPENITSGKEVVACKYTGEAITIGYNSTYLKDVLSHCGGEEVHILLKSSLGAGIFLSGKKEGVEKTTLLMPIRLND